MIKAIALFLSCALIALLSFWLGRHYQNEESQTSRAIQVATADMTRLAVHYDVLKKNREQGPVAAIASLERWLATDIESLRIYLHQLPDDQRERAERLIKAATPYQKREGSSNEAF
jgi:hypothetical protein